MSTKATNLSCYLIPGVEVEEAEVEVWLILVGEVGLPQEDGEAQVARQQAVGVSHVGQTSLEPKVGMVMETQL